MMHDMTRQPLRSVTRPVVATAAQPRVWDMAANGQPAGTAHTRASSGRVWVPNGTLSLLPGNVARHSFNPLLGTARGYLSEQGTTNYARATNAASNAWWTKTFCSAGATTTGPDGTQSLTKIVLDSTSNRHYISQTVSILSAGTYWCISMYVKAAEQRCVGLYGRSNGTTNTVTASFDVSDQTTTTAVTGTGVVNASGIETCGNGIYRVWLAGRTSATDTAVAFEWRVLKNDKTVTFVGDGVSGVYMGCFQLEVGCDQPSSYIENTGTTADVARASDVLTATNLADLGWNTRTGTVLVDFMLPSAGVLTATKRVMELVQDSSNRLLVTYDPAGSGSGLKLTNVYGGTQVNVIVTGSKPLGYAVNRLAVSYTPTQISASLNGGVVANGSIGGLGAFNRVSLGRSETGSFGLNGWMRRVDYVPFANLNLQALSGV